MARRVFFSFDWDDVWRVNQVRNCVVALGVQTAGYIDAADIEAAKRQTDAAIQRWIDQQLNGTSVTVVLVGSGTCSSRWVQYEVAKSRERGNGLLGINISGLKNQWGQTSVSCGCYPGYPYGYYTWDSRNSLFEIGNWIETAALHAGR